LSLLNENITTTSVSAFITLDFKLRKETVTTTMAKLMMHQYMKLTN